MDEGKEVSIQLLLDNLCRSIYKDVSASQITTAQHVLKPSVQHSSDQCHIIPEKLLKKCKLRAYEILLKKNSGKTTSNDASPNDEGYSDMFNPIHELKFSQFEYDLFVGQVHAQFHAYSRIQEKQKTKILQKHALFHECVKFVEENPYFNNEQGEGYFILWFLILLKNTSTKSDNDDDKSLFTLQPTRMASMPSFEPKIFTLNWHQEAIPIRNPYLSEGVCRMLSGSSSFRMSAGSHHNQHLFEIETSQKEEIPEMTICRRPQNVIQYTSNKWEELGHRYFLPKVGSSGDDQFALFFEKKFGSECSGSALRLAAIHAQANRKIFQARIVDTNVFIKHIKLLLIGIESESFAYDADHMNFKLLDHLTVENSTPSTVNHFVSDFIECGTCYKRLKVVIAKGFNNFKLKYNGFLFKALCSSLDKYLEAFRRFVIFEKNETIAELSVRVAPLIKQMRALAKILAIHPDDAGKEIPRGSEFLGYLYKQIIGVTQKDISILLVLMLTDCCGIYFRHSIDWIFHGIMDDPCKELFIEFIDHYVPKTKYFFDKAYTIKRQSVPGFLQGWEDSILLCGKYTNLLKLYKPTHPLFSVPSPNLFICLSFAQLKATEAECQKYKALAQSACGSPFAIEEIFRLREEKRKSIVSIVAEKCRREIEQWQLDRNRRFANKQEQREKDRLELLQQIQENRERKIKKRREQLALDQEYLQQSEMAELALVARENEQRKKNIEYYTELAEIVDAQRNRTESDIAALKVKLSAKEEAKVVTLASPDADSDTESVYFDAERSPQTINSDRSLCDAEKMVSEDINSNPVTESDELAIQRSRNRANVLNSNIHLSDAPVETPQTVAIPSEQKMTEAQKNRLKTLQHEYGFSGPSIVDTNSNQIVVQPTELSDLQKNRNRVLTSEFGITPAVVSVPADTDTDNNHDVNANAMTDLQRNRQKVLAHEYNLVTSASTKSKESRKSIKASLSLELNSEQSTKPNGLSVKACQSEFMNSPMSTTSDDLLATSMTNALVEPAGKDADSFNEDTKEKTTRKSLKLDCVQANEGNSNEINLTAFTADIDERPTPLSALNTAGIECKRNGFSFVQKPTTFSQMLRPTFSNYNMFDLSPQLSASKINKVAASSPVNQSSKTLTRFELQDLNTANLTNFLQQSFTIPLQVHLSILNNEILKIFFDDFNIFGQFQSLRNYFFMMDGEFASNISDGILTKLQSVQKPHELLNSHVLHSILENALQSSLIGNDKNAENLSFFIPNVPEEFDMASPNVLHELHLSYKVDWPLNLLLSAESIEHYGRVFQHLLKLRRIRWSLEQCFYKLKDIRKQSAEMIQRSPQFRHVQQIRHKLLCFVNALQTHITSVALQGSWQLFEQDVKGVKSMEDLYKKHTKYLKRVEFLCMLNRSSQEFYAKIEDVFVIILRFCSKLQSKNWKCNDHGIYTHPKYEKIQQIETDFMNLIKFIIYAGKKMSQRGYQTEIGEFIYMININGFYD